MYDRQESKCVCGKKIVWSGGGRFWVHAEYIPPKEKHIAIPADENWRWKQGYCPYAVSPR